MNDNTNNNNWSQNEPVDAPIQTQQPVQDVAEPVDVDASQLENMTNEEFLNTFANGLLIEKNLGDMDDETRAEMVQDLVERITTFVNRAILEALPEDKLDNINQMADGNGSLDDVNRIVQESGVNTEQIITEALEKFRDLYLNNENAEI